MINHINVNKLTKSKYLFNNAIKKLDLKFFKNTVSNLRFKCNFININLIYYLIKKGNFEK